MKNIVITIGREYGSGGKYIGEKLAKKLDIPFYDKELITKTYEKSGCNYSKLEQYDETKKSSFLQMLDLFQANPYAEAFSSEVYQTLMNRTIHELAESGSCVILGRNANRILKDCTHALHIFIYCKDMDFKVKRKMELLHLSYEESLKRIKQMDKKRKAYYESVNKNSAWGSRNDYDFCIDSSVLGVDGTVDLIAHICHQLIEK